MKLYCFYLVDEKIIEKMSNLHLLESLGPEVIQDGKFFYGFTKDEKLAKIFEKIHNHSIVKVVKRIEKEDYAEIKSCYRGFQLIEEMPLRYATNENICLPITAGEHWYVKESREETINELREGIFKFPIWLFEPELAHTLLRLGVGRYVDHGIIDIDEIIGEDPLYQLIKENDMQNEFGAYCYIYKDILNLEACVEEGRYEKRKTFSQTLAVPC